LSSNFHLLPLGFYLQFLKIHAINLAASKLREDE
jgi:hypothetical protein